MIRLLLCILLFVCAVWAQTPPPVDVQLCFTPSGGTQTCHTFLANTTSMVTIDLRNTTIPVVVIQPLPTYIMKAMQDFVNGATYRQQQLGGGILTKPRFDNVQDLLIQHLIKSVIVPALKIYPATGADAGKESADVVKSDLIGALTVYPAFVQ